jgi:hypothetical protein
MSACVGCNGDGEATFGGYGEGIPFDAMTCPRCQGSGEEPQVPTTGAWEDHYDYYMRTGHGTAESVALADRDMDTIRCPEELVYY